MVKPEILAARRLPYLLRVILARPRLAISVALGIAVALWPAPWWLTTRLLVAWDAGAGLYLVLVGILMVRSGAEHIRGHAAREDEGRVGILVLTVFAALASLGAIVVELGGHRQSEHAAIELALAMTTIVLSWFLIHTIFALHYAHDYYGNRGAKQSGLNFPGDETPDYWDFVYFSLVIGMTSQVSDVAVAAKPIRRTVTAHGVVSFFFNVALLALMVNIAASAL
ncbi:MAG: DUF1345 domain-containing protein [Xanthobacteraceae bacterium]